MNKYLLLRDNKQSGPYTVPELIEKGIKAYDLVWLEGKSAAWRYPSEIEELKAYAPVVEEQPFDRFYKRPEPVKQQEEVKESVQVVKSDYSRYEPKPVEQPAIVSEPSKKVYINFPGTQKKAIEQKPEVVIEKKIEQPVFAESLLTSESRPFNIRDKSPRRENNYFLYGTAAACLLLISLITYLVINHNKQRQNIEALNALVQQLDKKTKEQKTVVVPAAVVHEEIPAPPASVNYSEEITDEKPVAPTVKPGNSSVEKPRSGISEKESVVFKEAKTSPAPPVNLPPVTQGSESDKSVPHENLFKLVSVKPNKYKTGVLGGISNLQLELTNNSIRELQKVAVEIKYLGPEKKVVRTQTVYFENIPPGAQTTLDVPKSNRGVTIDYTITDIKS